MKVILTHEHADFDALASMLAASKLHPQATPVLPRALNRNLQNFLVLYRHVLPFKTIDELPRITVSEGIFVDTQSAQLVRGMTQQTPVRIIEHHPCRPTLPPHYQCHSEPVGATTTLLVEQIIHQRLPLTPVEATLLMLGIYEDTGSLSYINTTPRDITCAAWLLEQHAKLDVLRTFLHHPLSPAQQRLFEQLYETAQTHRIQGHTVVISTARVAEPVEEISTLGHKLRDLYDPDALFLLVDMGDYVQIVARATTNNIHVGEIAKALGGGGHARAAAALARQQSIRQLLPRLLQLLSETIRPQITVQEIMSWGVNKVRINNTVAQVAERMARRGHEGFPVVDETGQLQGLVTRRIIDMAMRHNMQHHPVSEVMRVGAVTVRLHDGIPIVKKKMLDSSWGQIPVVDEEGKMLGIVTRTDLLKLWDDEALVQRPQVSDLMARLLPAPLIALLKRIGDVAVSMNRPIYTVGGFARDLLLNHPNFDVDFVVEGDALLLAQKLAAALGGRVRPHRRFGTAKWIRDNSAFAAGVPLPDGTPASIDFVTARTEFYASPTALPTVESSSIKLDLLRRDFTINTLAIRMDGSHWGELLDFYGGRADLESGLIRVLHSLSFIEDPTRILRAVRFEQRFEFHIEPRTLELMLTARDMLPRVSGPRLRHEIELILQETQPENALDRLHQLGVLQEIDASLAWDKTLQRKFEALRQLRDTLPHLPAAMERLYLALWVYPQSPPAHDTLIKRLRLTATTAKLLRECTRLRAQLPQLQRPEYTASALDALLSPFSDAALMVARVAEENPLVQKHLKIYCQQLRPRQIHISGADLQALDVKPGPIYRRVFQQVRAALLDGQIHTPAEELALARKILAAEKTGKTKDASPS